MAMFIRYNNYFGVGDTLIDWNIEEFCGYTPITTYYTDFSIADHFGVDAIKDTFKRCKKQAIEFGHTWVTELAMVMNWKQWEHDGITKNDELVSLYYDLWVELEKYVHENFTQDELTYYYRTTD